MTDSERIERLEMLLKSAEDMVGHHLQARLNAEAAVAGLAREPEYSKLQSRIQQLETQLDYCLEAAENGKAGNDRLQDLRDYFYIYSPALEQVLNLHGLLVDTVEQLDEKRAETDRLRKQVADLAQRVLQLGDPDPFADILHDELEASAKQVKTIGEDFGIKKAGEEHLAVDNNRGQE